MITVTVIFVCVSAFLFGFLLGISGEPEVAKRTARTRAENEKAAEMIKKEYENFLNYDGSEQN